MYSQRSGFPRAAAVLLAYLVCASPAVAGAPFRFDTNPGQLPKSVLPRAYRIDLDTDAEGAKFTAHEEVDINVAQATASITLNATDLTFESVELAEEPGVRAQVVLDPKAQTATLRFPAPLTLGMHTLRIAYAGHISSQPAGIYYNDYATAGGRRRMIVTQFEATDARRMFPGWDEPAFKATFSLSVVIPSNEVAISNMPVASEAPAGRDRHGRRLKKVSFATTPSMSTYLVVLLAGELESVRTSAAGVDIAAWAVKGKASLGRDAVGYASELLPYFNEYFGVDYPLPKLDLIAIPGNFDAGAMENWGAITFIDDSLLFDPTGSSESTRQDIYETVAHEMAHQWVGDLVTMAWWDDLWLNEGFASWMESKATDRMNPGWHVWLRAHADKEHAMASDSRSTAHAIQSEVANESDAKTLFDDITYIKGAQVIRMLENYVGEEAFRSGMQRYIKRHAYSNATTADLWAELEAASGQPVAAIASSYTEQPGVPLIVATSTCADGRTQVELTQDRFTIHDPQAARLVWQVPVVAGVAGDPGATQTVVVGPDGARLGFAGCDVPVKINLGDVGYYRVAYDARGLRLLKDHYAALAAADRVGLLGDEWALAQAGRADIRAYLSLLSVLSAEDDLVVWAQVLSVVARLDDMLRTSPDRAAYRAWARGIVAPQLARLGWVPRPGESNGDVLLRGSVVDLLGQLGDPDVLAASRQRFATFLVRPASLDPSLRTAVTNNVGRQADQQTFDLLRKLGRSATGTEDKLRYYLALSQAQDPRFVGQIVAIALTDEIAPARVPFLLLTAAVYGPDPLAVWTQTLKHRDALLAKVSEDQRERLLPALAAATGTPSAAAELLAQPGSAANSGAGYEARKAVETIEARVEFASRAWPQMHQFLIAAPTP